MAWTSIDAAGKPVSGQAEFHFDGKDYAVPGSADYDAISLKRVDKATVEAILKKAGRVVGRSLRAVSENGKLMRVSVTLTDAKGVAVKEMRVFVKSNRQQLPTLSAGAGIEFSTGLTLIAWIVNRRRILTIISQPVDPVRGTVTALSALVLLL